MTLAESKSNYVDLIHEFMSHNHGGNYTVDYIQPYVRPSLKYVYPLFMFLHALVGMVGIIGNIAMVTVMGRRRLYHDQTFFLLGNLAFSDLIKCVFVLPMTLANLLIQNWIFGSFMCFFLPMMQFFPIHASMLTFVFMAIDRYRLIVNPFKSRVPAGLCTIAVWVIAVCVVLPYAVYIKYIDLEFFLGVQFNGVGICYVNLEKHIEEYIRAMFVTLYAMPLAIISFLYVKVSAELKCRESASVSVHFTSSTAEDALRAFSLTDSRYKFPRSSWPATEGGQRIDPEGASGESALASGESALAKSCTERFTQDSDDDLDIAKEKITQSYMIAMVTLFAMCWCPLNLLILVTYFVHENDDNRDHYDITFLTFTWFGFLSTCINPVLFASWKMSDTTKDRLKGYFRFSNRRRAATQVQQDPPPQEYTHVEENDTSAQNRK